MNMSAEREKALIRQFYLACNTGELEMVLPFIAPIFTDHAAPEQCAYGIEGFVQARKLSGQALREVTIEIDDLLSAERHCVVAMLTIHATQVGEYKGVPYPGHPRAITWRTISVLRCQHGKLIEHWECTAITPSPHHIPALVAEGAA